MSKSNDTRAEDLEEARALLRAHVLRALRGENPRASTLSVAHKFINDETDRLERERRLSGVIGSTDTSNLPFPADATTEAPPTTTAGVTAADLAALPFAPSESEDGDTE